MKRGKEEQNPKLFQQGGLILLPMRTKIISVFCGLILFLVACCPPATGSSISQETAFKATFLGISENQHYLLVQPEGSEARVQMVYDQATTLTPGQRIYVVGRLEGNVVYVSALNPL